MPRVLTVAHRAGNSAEGLRRAVEVGADVVEADLWPHRGRLEVRHLKTLGPVPVLWDRWEFASARAPRLLLEELLPTLPPGPAGPELMLDLKGWQPAAMPRIAAAVEAALPGRRYTVCSQNWSLLARFAGRPGVRVVHSAGSERLLRRLLSPRTADRITAVSVHRGLLTPARVAALRQRVPLLMTWPVADRASYDELVGWGVTGVISDDYALLRRVPDG